MKEATESLEGVEETNDAPHWQSNLTVSLNIKCTAAPYSQLKPDALRLILRIKPWNSAQTSKQTQEFDVGQDDAVQGHDDVEDGGDDNQ